MTDRVVAATGAQASFEEFRGDFTRLAAVMEASWAESSTPPFLYSAEFLSDCFAYPGMSLALAPTLYHGSDPIAFVAGFPRTVRVNGTDLRLLIAAFLTVSSELKSRGYGILAWSELVRRGRESGYDGMVSYCVEGEPMSRMIEGSSRRLGLPVTRAYTVGYLSKVLWPKRSEARPSAAPLPVSRFEEMASDLARRHPFARVWTDEEVRWQQGRLNGVESHLLTQDGAGLVDGYVMQIANPDRTGCLIVDDVLWGGLDGPERVALVNDLLGSASSRGARLAIVPDQGYADLEPFLAAGFRPSQRRIHAYLTAWSQAIDDEPLTSFYLDVF